MSDSDSDDMPIALLMKKKQEEKEKNAAKATNDKNADLKRARATKSASEGDQKRQKTQNGNKKTATPEKSKPKAKTPESSKKDSVKEKKQKSVREVVSNEEDIFGMERTEKHNIVSAILLRWKYCLDAWPGNVPAEPPHGFIESHVPGLYVGFSNRVLGQLNDTRPFISGKTPSMGSLLTYTAVELKDILVKGIQNQMAALGDTLQDEQLKKSLSKNLEKAEKLKVRKIERKYREAVERAKLSKSYRGPNIEVGSANGKATDASQGSTIKVEDDASDDDS